jgi:mRNA interferase RelE/StbE
MMMIDLTRDAGRFLENLPAKQYKQVTVRVHQLRQDPHPHDSKHLAGNPGYKRIDSNEYRIIYRLESEVVKVVVIGKRNDDSAYRTLRNKGT